MYSLTDRQRDIRKTAREFANSEIRPVAKRYDEAHIYPRDVIEAAGAEGLLAPNIPEQYDGPGLDLLSHALVTEEMWRVDPGIGDAVAGSGFGTGLIIDYGDEWMRERWLPAIAAGDAICATAVSEPAHGSNPAGMETTAERDDDVYRINGQKTWITNGSVADVVLLFAKTTPGAGHEGITAFLVPTNVDGYSADPITNKLGVHACDTASVYLSDVEIPAANVVGEVDAGFEYLMAFFMETRIDVAAKGVGVAQGALDVVRSHLDDSGDVGQATQHTIADLQTQTEAARALAYHAADLVDSSNGWSNMTISSMAKYFCSERAVDVVDESMDILGMAGYTSEYPLERFLRDARLTPIYDGTSEIQLNIIANSVL